MLARYGYLVNRWVIIALALAAIGAVLAVSLSVRAQQADDPIKFPEIPEGMEKGADLEVASFTAVDPEGGTAKWEMVATASAGADQALFNFKDGVLSFKEAPDYEDPGDADDDNTYVVVLQADDGTEEEMKTVMVEVTNVEEAATIGIDLEYVQPREAEPITVVYKDSVGNPYVSAAGAAHTAIVDPDGVKGTDPSGTVDTTIPDADVTWQWSRGSSRTGTFTDITEAENPSRNSKIYEPIDRDRTFYLRVTATYEDGEAKGKVLEATSLYPTLEHRADDKSPLFPEDFDGSQGGAQGPSAEVGDGTTDEARVGTAVRATGERGERLTYSLVSDGTNDTHADLFQIDRATGQVMVGKGKTVNPESDENENVPGPKSLANGTFIVKIMVADGLASETVDTTPVSHTDEVDMTVTVKPEVDEAPVFTKGDMAHSYAENKKVPDPAPSGLTAGDPDLRVYTFMAYDPEDGDVSLTLTGPDKDKFTLPAAVENADSPVTNTWDSTLSFREAPDYEKPGDANKDRIYEVIVTAAATNTGESEKKTPLNVTVTVTNEQDPGELDLSARQPRIGVRIMAENLSDKDGAVSDVTWQWQRDEDGTPASPTTDCNPTDPTTITWEEAKGDGAKTDTYTPASGDDGKCLRVTASYTDPAGPTSTNKASGQPVQKARTLPPMFKDEDDTVKGRQIKPRYVVENVAAGGPVVADDDGETADTATPSVDQVQAEDILDADTTDNADIAYSLSGSGASLFDISSDGGTVSVGGRITVKAANTLDYETRRSYRLTVTAEDLEGLKSSVMVTINVVDDNEGPEIKQGKLAVSGPPYVSYPSMGTGDVATYKAVGVDAGSATFSLSGDDSGDFNIHNTSGVLTFRSAPDSSNPMDADGDNAYEVTIEANNGGDPAKKDVIVMVAGETPDGPRTSLDQYTNQERLDLNGDGTVSDDELRQAITIWIIDNPEN